MYNYHEYEGLNGYNVYDGTRSVNGMIENDLNTRYFMRSLYQRLYAGLSVKCPSLWNKNYFKNVLFGQGFIGIIDHPDYGVIPQICAPTGERGIFLQPTKILVSQPLVKFEGDIGVNCEVVRLTPDWLSVIDIVEHYAVRMAIAITSYDVAMINNRAAFMAAGKNKSAIETIKQLYEDMTKGKPLLVYDKALKDDGLDESDPIWTFSADLKNNYISDKILADLHTIREDFDTEIGIAAIGDKKERMITDEVDKLTADSTARAETWFDMLTQSFDKVNELFPELGLSFSMKYGGESHEYGEN